MCPLLTSGAGLDKAGTGLVPGVTSAGTGLTVIVVLVVEVPALEL
jgi:hypothetical protein